MTAAEGQSTAVALEARGHKRMMAWVDTGTATAKLDGSNTVDSVVYRMLDPGCTLGIGVSRIIAAFKSIERAVAR